MQELDKAAREHLNKVLDQARHGMQLMELCSWERGRGSCVSLIGDLENARQSAADELDRPEVDRVVFTATRSIDSTREVYCEAFDDTGASCAVACAYRKAGLVWKRAGEVYFAEPPEPLPETTAQRQSRFDFDDFVQDMLANPSRGLAFGKSVRISLPTHRRDGIDWQYCEEVHSVDEACRPASVARDSDYVGVVFRLGKSLTVVAWDLTSEERVALRIPVKKTFWNPSKIVGRPEQLPPPPPVK